MEMLLLQDSNMNIKTPEKIHHEIANMLSSGVSHIDALVLYSEKHNIEIEVLAEIVKKSEILKEKVRGEAKLLNLMKKDSNVTNRLF
jgi:predicted aldo/keto reductase-like oxidoreductase